MMDSKEPKTLEIMGIPIYGEILARRYLMNGYLSILGFFLNFVSKKIEI